MPQDKLPEPGEFTRIFKRQHPAAHNGVDAEKSVSEPSSVFEAMEAMPAQAPPLHIPPPASASAEPGEFTRYFMGGLPPQAGKTQRTPSGVQRPNTPVPSSPRTLTGDSSTGSFTDRFGSAPRAAAYKPDEYGVHNPRIGPAPDLREDNSPFDFRPAVSPATSAAGKDGPGEYTMLFGRGNIPPEPRQAAVAVAPAAPMMSDSPNSLRGMPSSAEASSQDAALPGPSEFTVVSNGRQGVATAAAPKMPLNINLSPLASGGSVGMSGAHLNTPIGSANLQAPSLPHLNAAASAPAISRLTDQTKLILFFAALAILAVILVVVVVATQKN